MIPRKVNLLREFCDFICENCGKHEDEVGRLQPHRIKQGGAYSLRNVKLVCEKCHGLFSSAQNRAMGISNGK